jgi:hypothetical protein
VARPATGGRLARRALLTAVPMTALVVGLDASRPVGSVTVSERDLEGHGAGPGSGTALSAPLDASPATSAPSTSTPRTAAQRVSVAARRGPWLSGVVGENGSSFGRWRGARVSVLGLYGDRSDVVQDEQWQFTHSTFTGVVDLAVGGPVTKSWAQVADGALLRRWTAMARRLRTNHRCRRLYLRFAHEANGTWMPWSVAAGELEDFHEAFRLFATTMRRELHGRPVRIAFAPNHGTWHYSPEDMWPGNDVVDVVGVSMYEWEDYSTPDRWADFASSPIGPDAWLAFAARHGKPMALSEWGAHSPYFLERMNAWLAQHAGTTGGRLLYDVYMNQDRFELTGRLGRRYRSLHWGR